MKHLSDEEIQDYLDGNAPHKKNRIEDHLKSCVHCQNLLSQYQELYIDLKQEPQFQLSEEWIPAIMKKLVSMPKTRLLFRFAKNLLLGIGFLWLTTVAITIAYLIDSKPWKEIYSQSSDLISDLQTLFFASIDQLLSDLVGKPYLLLFAGLALLTVAVIDHWIIQPRIKKLSL